MTSAPTESESPSLASRLGGTHVGLRPDLEITRHVFRKVVAYVVTDPMTFSSHRVSTEDYQIMVRLEESRSLAEIWSGIVEDGVMDEEDAERFFQFVLQLHKMNFLSLPLADHTMLYERHVERRKAERKKWFMAPFFLPIPIWNPDRFLDRTIHVARLAFTKAFFVLWIGLVATAGLLLFKNWDAFQLQLGDTFALANLPVVSVSLVVLKVLHELGHAYACKRFGGRVPEMGVFLIVFVPCAYVDASASWSFNRKIERLIVCLAGMYFELTVAALAVFVWCMSSGSVTSAIAHNVIMLASVVTIGFNINPLMRFDGYYAFSDMVEVPNLRERATGYASALVSYLALGTRDDRDWGSAGHRVFLFVFGLSAAIYKVTLVLGISAVIASKYFFAGIFLGAVYIGMEIMKIAGRVARSLWRARESSLGRVRAAAAFAILIAALPCGTFFVPLPGRIVAPAVVGAELETVVRADTAGFLEAVHIRPGEAVSSTEVLASLREPEIGLRILEADAGLAASDLRLRAARSIDRTVALQEQERREHHRRLLESARHEQSQLEVVPPVDGVVTQALEESDVGRFLKAGEPVATIASGRLVVKALLKQDDVARVRPEVGRRVTFRASGQPDRSYQGTVLRMHQSANRRIDAPSLQQSGTGDVPVDPNTGEATQPYLEVCIVLDDPGDLVFRRGMTGKVRLQAESETVAQALFRSVLLLKNRLASDS